MLPRSAPYRRTVEECGRGSGMVAFYDQTWKPDDITKAPWGGVPARPASRYSTQTQAVASEGPTEGDTANGPIVTAY